MNDELTDVEKIIRECLWDFLQHEPGATIYDHDLLDEFARMVTWQFHAEGLKVVKDESQFTTKPE